MIKGVVRPMDDVGRIVIPKELRDQLNWLKGDKIEIHIHDKGLFIVKHEPTCLVCGDKFALVKLGGHTYCKQCLNSWAEHSELID